jgi:hypothetical protein
MVEQPEPAKFGENIAPVAAAPTGGEHSACVAIAEDKAVSAVQRTAAAPSTALAARVAERRSDLGRRHEVTAVFGLFPGGRGR